MFYEKSHEMDSQDVVTNKPDKFAALKKVVAKFQAMSFKKRVASVIGAGVFVLLAIGIYSATHTASHSNSHSKVVAVKEGELDEHGKPKKREKREIASYVEKANFLEKIVLAYRQAFVSVQHKVDEIYRAREENVHLRRQNAKLRIELEKTKFEQSDEESSDETAEKSIVLDKETGSKVGRTVASIEYRWPDNFSREQLYTLGLGFMKTGEYEKSSKIFHYLIQNGGEDFDKPEMALVTGVSLYYIDAYDVADKYFESILKSKLKPEQKPIASKARLFRALISKRKDQNLKAQYWLRDLMEHDPHSKEAAYVNSAHGGNHGSH